MPSIIRTDVRDVENEESDDSQQTFFPWAGDPDCHSAPNISIRISSTFAASDSSELLRIRTLARLASHLVEYLAN